MNRKESNSASAASYLSTYLLAFPRTTLIIIIVIFVSALYSYLDYGIFLSFIGSLSSVFLAISFRSMVLVYLHKRIFCRERRLGLSLVLIFVPQLFALFLALPILIPAVRSSQLAD